MVYTYDTQVDINNMTTKFIGVREFRQHMAELYQKSRKMNIRYIVLNKNKPMFEVMPISDKQNSLEDLAKIVAEARRDVAAGRVYSLEEIKKSILARSR